MVMELFCTAFHDKTPGWPYLMKTPVLVEHSSSHAINSAFPFVQFGQSTRLLILHFSQT